MEALVAEANAASAAAEPVSPRTRYPAPEAGQGKFKPKEVVNRTLQPQSTQ